MRDGQPRNRLRVNWSHPLTNGCVFLPMYDVSAHNVVDVLLPGTMTYTPGTAGISRQITQANAWGGDWSGTLDTFFASSVAPTVTTNRISVWYLYVANNTGNQDAFTRWDTGNASGSQFLMRLNSAGLGQTTAFFKRDGTTNVSVAMASAHATATGSVGNEVATYDGATARIYANGILSNSASSSGTLNSTSIVNYRVGAQINLGNDPIWKFIAGGVWDRVLSIDEITMLRDDPWCMLRVDPAPLMMRTWRIPVYGGAVAGQGVAANPTLRGRGWQ